MKNENTQIQETYDNKIDELETDNKDYMNRLENKLVIEKSQRRKIVELQNKCTAEERVIEEEKLYFEEKIMIKNIRFQELEAKYANLQKKVYEIEMNSNIRKAEMSDSGRPKRGKETIEQEIDGIRQCIDSVEKDNEDMEMKIKSMMHILGQLNNRNLQRKSSVDSRLKRKLSRKKSM